MRSGRKDAIQMGSASQGDSKDSIGMNVSELGSTMPFYDDIIDSHTAPLSVQKYAPPATQYTAQHTGFTQNFDGATQSQWTLDGPSQTHLAGPPRTSSNHGDNLGAFALPQQWRAPVTDGEQRPWKRACR